jgi:hypothetical protein
VSLTAELGTKCPARFSLRYDCSALTLSYAFIEISDPWDAKNTIRALLRTAATII